MPQMTLEIPQALAELPEQERNLLVQAGLYEAWRARVRELAEEVAEAEVQVRQYETQYGMPLDRFETEILPTTETLPIHEAYNDWFFWQHVLVDKQARLNRIRNLRLR